MTSQRLAQETRGIVNLPARLVQSTTGGRSRRWMPSLVLGVVLAILIAVPLGVLLYATFIHGQPFEAHSELTVKNYVSVFSSGSSAILNSIYIGVGGTALAVFIGATIAWLAARTDAPGKSFIQLTGITPLFFSSLIGAIGWSLLASPRQGYLNLALDSMGLPKAFNVYSIYGMILVFGLYNAPYVFLFVNNGLSLLNPELEEAARVHGASEARVLWTVTLRLVAPTLLGAATLVIALVMENFPIPSILGTPNGIETIASRIYDLMANVPQLPNRAAANGIVLLVIVGVMITVQRWLLSRGQYATVTGKGFKPRLTKLGKWRWVGFTFALLYALVATVLPLAALIIATFRPNPFVRNFAALFDPKFYNLSAMRYATSLDGFKTGIINSVLVGIGVAVFGGLLYFALAYFSHRGNSPGKRYIAYVAMWPAAVPALVIGLGFLWTWVHVSVIYGTLAILILAYITRFTPQGYQGVSSSIIQIHPEMEESAMVSGANRLRTVRSVLVPLTRGGIVSTMVLLFILSMRELSVAIFLFTSQTQVLSVTIFTQWVAGRFPPVAAMSLIYIAMLFVIAGIARRWLGLYGGSGKSRRERKGTR